MSTLKTRLLASLKALVAVVTPIATVAALEAVTELSRSSDTILAAIATAVLVYLVPNRDPES